MKSSLCMIGLGLVFFCFFAWGQNDSSARAAKSTGAAENIATLDSILFATGIEKRVPVGVSKEFGPSVKKVFCWTKVSIQNAPLSLKHVWYNDEEKVSEIPLTLNFASGRLWSYKTVSPGQWKVEVVTEAGVVLGSAGFTAK